MGSTIDITFPLTASPKPFPKYIAITPPPNQIPRHPNLLYGHFRNWEHIRFLWIFTCMSDMSKTDKDSHLQDDWHSYARLLFGLCMPVDLLLAVQWFNYLCRAPIKSQSIQTSIWSSVKKSCQISLDCFVTCVSDLTAIQKETRQTLFNTNMSVSVFICL